MFDEIFRHCHPNNEIKPSKKRVSKNIAAVKSLIETEGELMTKRKLKLKPLIITAAIITASVVSLLTVNAASGGAVVKFFMGGEEIEGGYRDYVDHDGYRHVSFGATVPIEEYCAIIFDVDAPSEEAVRVITKDTDPDFIDRLRQYREAKVKFWETANVVEVTSDDVTIKSAEVGEGPEPEDFGLVFKDSELCSYRYNHFTEDGEFFGGGGGGELGGEFRRMGVAEGHPSGSGDPDPRDGHIDYESGTIFLYSSFYYYVGKE